MALNARMFSLLLRRWHSVKESARIARRFDHWRRLAARLPAPRPAPGTLLLIRLDDIGDYLLFRNQLRVYQQSVRWQHHHITLLGNASWRELHELLDSDTVHACLWIDKARYLASAAYRADIWESLRARRVETVIAPSRTRPLLLDDLCTLAAAPLARLGCANTTVHARWNRKSDALYSDLFVPGDARVHEFEFNAQFTEWVCGMRSPESHPTIEYPTFAGGYVLCFIGANTRSKRWPAVRWIEFINAYRRRYPGGVVVAGHGAAEVAMANEIERRTGAQNIAGATSLTELVHWIAGARAVVSNDTMAAHLGAACGRPTVIIANGVNYQRFTDYQALGVTRVATVYPEVFTRRRARLGECRYDYIDAVTADLASIAAPVVLDRLTTIDPWHAHAAQQRPEPPPRGHVAARETTGAR